MRRNRLLFLGALILLGSFDGGGAMSAALQSSVTWMQRAFAPASPNRSPRLQQENSNSPDMAFMSTPGPLLWIRRAMAPSITPHHLRLSPSKSSYMLRSKAGVTTPLLDEPAVSGLYRASVADRPSPDADKSVDLLTPLNDDSNLPLEGRDNFQKSRKISAGYEVLYDVKDKEPMLPLKEPVPPLQDPLLPLEEGVDYFAGDNKADPTELLRDMHQVLDRVTSSLPHPMAAPDHSNVVELAVAWLRFVEVASAIHGEGIRELSWLPEKSLEHGRSWAQMSLDFLNNTATKTTDSALWLFSHASSLNPRSLSKATMHTIEGINSKVVKTLEGEISRLMGRFEKELLGLKRQSVPERKNPPSCFVMGMDGVSRQLNYGEAIPSLLFMKEKGEEMFDPSPKVAIETDAKGNLIVKAAHAGQAALPLSSDVMWMRQMAAYSADVTGECTQDGCELECPVTVAAVTLPVNERGDVLVTQRASRGMYNGMWVFPGGHVDGDEGVVQAAQREVFEETGIKVDKTTLKARAVWEGSVTSKRRQFCVIFFEALAKGVSPKLQTKEVVRATWVPRDLVPRILDTHVWHEDEIDGIHVVDGKQMPAKIKLSDLQQGLGSGHKFALKQYLEARDRRERKRVADPSDRLIPANVLVPTSPSPEPMPAFFGMVGMSGMGRILQSAFH
mmetsp:Transcript_46466/g.109979  ORF Transcript_46466/g.109979 Transcript_46466/m.109979 type:complete len:673 (-) Transcript_46466:132-2150(-)